MTQGEMGQEVRKLVQERSWDRIRELVQDQLPAEVAEVLTETEGTERALFYRSLPPDVAADVFAYLDPDTRETLLDQLTDQETRAVVEEMEPDDRTRLLSELPDTVVQSLLKHLSQEELAEARWLLGYPEESVGRLMTPDYLSVQPAWTVRHALDHIRERGEEYETVATVYVEEEDGTLVDAVSVRRLLMAEPNAKISEFVRGPVIRLEANQDREEAVRAMERYDLPVLPVVGERNRMLGIVTHDDVMDVAEDEFTEDMYRLAGISWSEEEAGRSARILEGSLWEVLRLRVPWLLVALAGGLMAGGVVGQFEDTLEAIVILAFFIPVIMDMGGNVGTQASTIFVRGFALGHITDENVIRHIFREFRTGLTVGLIMGAVGGLAAWAWQGIPELGIVILVSMTVTCAVASLVGFLIPWVAHKAGGDPAAVSDPFITTVKDVTGLLIYFGLATWLLAALL